MSSAETIQALPETRHLTANNMINTRLFLVDELDVVLRRPLSEQYIADEDIVESDTQFAKLLMDLEENYGIETAGMMQMKATKPGETSANVFVGAQKVEGVSIGERPEQVPEDKVRQCIQEILRYYLDMTNHGGSYLSDLRPQNCMYGKIDGEPDPSIYFMDFDPSFQDTTKGDSPPYQLDNNVRGIVMGDLVRSIETLERSYGENYADLRQALEELKATQKYRGEPYYS